MIDVTPGKCIGCQLEWPYCRCYEDDNLELEED